MTERPILFSAPMVRAILDGRKTQTRRVVKLPHQNPLGVWDPGTLGPGLQTSRGEPFPDQVCISHTRTGDTLLCPYGVPGDMLWVRERWALHEKFSDVARVVYPASLPDGWNAAHEDFPVELAARITAAPYQQRQRPSIHMPRWASRITLRITDVRVERLDDISAADSIAEGVDCSLCAALQRSACARLGCFASLAAYRDLWEHINGPGSWAANPWVWAVSFERVRP